jgi:hypothetical protein
MARNTNRRQIVAKAIQARSPRATGGTSAPRSAARGGTTDLGGRKQVTGPWSPKGESKKTAYAKGFGASAGVTPAPGAAAPSPYVPTPWDSKAEQIVSGARKSYLDASGNFDLNEQTAKRDFGLDPGFNDYKSNPNSRAALLEQSYQAQNRGTTNSAGLQLYSGSTSNRLGANRANYGTNRDELAKAYRDSLGEISAGRTKAAEDKAEKEREAEWERIAAAEGSEPEAEASPAGKAKAKKPSRKKQTQQAVANNRKAR